MPYIKPEDRLRFNNIIQSLKENTPNTAGELNYLITRTVLQYLEKHTKNYQTYNDIIGALEGAKLEIYRRSVAKYENGKVEQNGDVYPKY